MDGELDDALSEQVDAHCEDCPACRTWQAEASAHTRNLRVRPVTPTPDLVSSILPHVPDAATEPGRIGTPRRIWAHHRNSLLRLALGALASAQLVLGAAQIFGMGEHGHAGHESASTHLFNESTAWNLALGAGLLWAAVRNRSAAGILPVLSVFLVVLTGFSAYDLSVGAVAAGRVASHGLLALGLGLLFGVHRTNSGNDPSPSSVEDRGADVDRSDLGVPEPTTPGRKHKRTPHLRPSASHRAA